MFAVIREYHHTHKLGDDWLLTGIESGTYYDLERVALIARTLLGLNVALQPSVWPSGPLVVKIAQETGYLVGSPDWKAAKNDRHRRPPRITRVRICHPGALLAND